MKKFNFFTTSMIMALLAGSCKKAVNDKCKNDYSGGFPITTTATIWISKDKGWGQLTVKELYYIKEDGSKMDGTGNARGKIDRYFTSTPDCGTEGTISFSISPGQKVEYKLISDNGKIYDGWIKAGCDYDCHTHDISK